MLCLSVCKVNGHRSIGVLFDFGSLAAPANPVLWHRLKKHPAEIFAIHFGSFAFFGWLQIEDDIALLIGELVCRVESRNLFELLEQPGFVERELA